MGEGDVIPCFAEADIRQILLKLRRAIFIIADIKAVMSELNLLRICQFFDAILRKE